MRQIPLDGCVGLWGMRLRGMMTQTLALIKPDAARYAQEIKQVRPAPELAVQVLQLQTIIQKAVLSCRLSGLQKPHWQLSAHSVFVLLQLIEQDGFTILEAKRLQLSEQRAQDFYAEHVGKSFFGNLKAFMTSGHIWALLLAAPDAVPKWRALMGPTNTQKARAEAPQSLRAIYGTGARASLAQVSCLCR